MHLFVYGSLMFERVWCRVARGSYAQRPARLHGFTRRKVRHDVYPVVFPSNDCDSIDGLVYLDVTTEDIERLDCFEGEFYDRQTHAIVVEGHETCAAAVYVLRHHYDHMIDSTEWDPQWFAAEGLGIFLGQYEGC